MKFLDPELQERVRKAYGPGAAARIGRDTSLPLRADWELMKEHFMRIALRAKFAQHPELREALLDSGDATLIEHTENDSYWGDGGTGKGKNRLGVLLMELRAELKEGVAYEMDAEDV